MALARCVGGTWQSGKLRPYWSQALKSHTFSRSDAADAAAGCTSPRATASANSTARARIRRVRPGIGILWSPPSAVAARRDRYSGRSVVDGLGTARASLAIAGDERAAVGTALRVRCRCEAQHSAAVDGARAEVLGVAVVLGGAAAGHVDAEGAEARRGLHGVAGLLVADRGEDGGAVGRPGHVGQEVGVRRGVDDGVLVRRQVADPQGVDDGAPADLYG